MVKIKVYELAKELDLESKDVIKRLQKMGFEAKSHMVAVDDKYADMLRQSVKGNKGKAGPAAGGFVPKVTRIPKAEVQEAALEAEKTIVADGPIVAKEKAGEGLKELESPAVEKDQIKADAEKAEHASAMVEQEVIAVKEIAPSVPKEEKTPIFQEPSRESSVEKKSAAAVPPAQKPMVKKAPVPGQSPKKTFDKAQSRPQRPQTGEGPRPNRPSTGNQGKPAPYTRNSDGYKQRPGGAQDRPARPQAGRPDRPQSSAGYQGKDRPERPQSRNEGQGRSQKAKQPLDPNMKYVPVIEKPAGNYRPEKKVFVKDIIHERSHEAEKAKKGKFNKNKDNKNFRNRKEIKREMPAVVPKKIIIGETVILGELAKSMSKTAAEIIKKLFELGIMATINQELDSDTAILIADEFGITVEVKADKAAEIMEDIEDDEKMMQERPPIVTVMGHVDHGKTSLLDAIRKTDVIATEAGGITQHIGAYQVEIKNKKITFLDTPGHEAFTAMRARGAQITDISILVVAADDGVMPQTIEAINHSKAAKVPIIVAINKIDKEAANPDRVKQALVEHGLVPEEWGGDTVMVPVSAKSGVGIENLLEMILLVAEVAELKANPKRQARGTVVEAKLDKNRGPVATLLVQKGTLKIGDNLLAGAVFGKVRAMFDYKGRKAKSAGPSVPIEVLGFAEVPEAGEIFISVKDDKDARLVAYKQQLKKREEELRKSSRVSLDDLFKRIEEGEIKDLNIIIKGDVQGSVEAVEQSLLKLNEETQEVKVNVIHAGVGGIKESDIMLASASNAIIIGFNVRPDANARKAAETEAVDIRLYRVIYDAIEDVKKAMSGLLEPELKEQIIGHVEVRQVFKVPKIGMVAGCYVSDGKVNKNASVRVVRDSIVIAESNISSLRRFKDDAKEVLSGFECGIGLENYHDLKEGDIMEIFVMEKVEREL